MDLSIHIFEGEAGSEGGNFRKTVRDKGENVRGCAGVVAEATTVLWTGVSLQNVLVWGCRGERGGREREEGGGIGNALL